MTLVTGQKNWDKKHGAILEAAKQVFISKGYAGTSMEVVAKEAGVSKVTIYKHFKTKFDLFNHIMENHCAHIFEFFPIIEYSPETSSRAILISFCHSFVEALLKPESVGLMRRIISEADTFPDLVSSIWKDGKLPLLEAFFAYLQEEVKEKRIDIPDVNMAGRQLFGMIKENLVYPIWFGLKPSHTPSEKAHIIQKCVDMFLAFYEPKMSESALLTFPRAI